MLSVYAPVFCTQPKIETRFGAEIDTESGCNSCSKQHIGARARFVDVRNNESCSRTNRVLIETASFRERRYCHTIIGPPQNRSPPERPRQKTRSPRTIHGRKYGPPRTMYGATDGPPLPPLLSWSCLSCGGISESRTSYRGALTLSHYL